LATKFFQVPWDEEHFNDLVAKWVATCNQPFAAVNKPEFREMLQYAALHPADKPIVIPKREAVKARIHAMEKEMVEELSAIFLACSNHSHQRSADRSILRQISRTLQCL
jgi:hypothetical protein